MRALTTTIAAALVVAGCGTVAGNSGGDQTCWLQDTGSIIKATGQSSCSELGQELAQLSGDYWTPMAPGTNLSDAPNVGLACTFPGITVWGNYQTISGDGTTVLCATIQQQGGTL